MDTYSPQFTERPVTILDVMFRNGQRDNVVLEAKDTYIITDTHIRCALPNEDIVYRCEELAAWRIKRTVIRTPLPRPVTTAARNLHP